MHSLLKSTKAVGAVIATSSLSLVGACSSNPESPSAPTAPPTILSEKSSSTIGSAAGFTGTSALSESIQNLTFTAAKDAVNSCVGSDDSKPIIPSSESIRGSARVMTVGDGGTAMLSMAENSVTVSRTNEKTESAENYVPYELPGEHAFSDVNKDSSFVTVIDGDNRIYQEFVFVSIDADAAQPLINETIQDSQQP